MYSKTLRAFLFTATACIACIPLQGQAAIDLGSAGDFAVLAGATITNTGPTVVSGGDIGVSPGNAVTGFPPGIAPAIHAGDAAALQAQADLTAAYNHTAGLTPTRMASSSLGGLTLLPGVYRFNSSADIAGTLTLDAQNDPDAFFVFQIASTLVTAANSFVDTINAGASPGSQVFWQVGSSATLGSGSAFEGHILALTSISLGSGATVTNGSLLARNGSVTLDSNTISNVYHAVSPVPEPQTWLLLLLGGALLACKVRGSSARTGTGTGNAGSLAAGGVCRFV